jgi:hypothetical protein
MRSDFMTKLFAPPTVRRHLAFAGAALIAAGVLAGCAAPEPRPPAHVVVTIPAPPPPRAEYQPPPPTERAVWDPGHWNWNGRDYVWVGGRYIERPNVAMRWEPGHWIQQGGTWAWVDGSWH